jgi:hypothetical protein
MPIRIAVGISQNGFMVDNPRSNVVICPGPGGTAQQYQMTGKSASAIVADATAGTFGFSCSQSGGTTTMAWTRLVNNGNPGDAQIQTVGSTNVVYAVGLSSQFSSSAAKPFPMSAAGVDFTQSLVSATSTPSGSVSLSASVTPSVSLTGSNSGTISVTPSLSTSATASRSFGSSASPSVSASLSATISTTASQSSSLSVSRTRTPSHSPTSSLSFGASVSPTSSPSSQPPIEQPVIANVTLLTTGLTLQWTISDDGSSADFIATLNSLSWYVVPLASECADVCLVFHPCCGWVLYSGLESVSREVQQL